MATKNEYEVIVGNIGSVYCGNDRQVAVQKFDGYRSQSKGGIGRAGGESVTMLDNGEIALEHIGHLDVERMEND